MRRLAQLLPPLVWLVAWLVAAEPIIELREDFGVAHPDQLLFVRPPRPLDSARETLLDESGQPTLFQVLTDGRIVLRTDLPANARRSYNVRAQAPPALPPQVTVTSIPGGWEIANDRLGIRLPATIADDGVIPCPIQGLRLADGTWTAAGPGTLDRPAHDLHFEWLERGPLLVRARIRYTLDRAALRGSREPEIIPAGTGFYQCTIEVQAGQPSILFEEEGDAEVSWSVPIHHGLEPDRARYRGHHSTSLARGRDTAGNWGHTWHPSREQNQFRQANGRPFEESQHLLRIRTTGSIVYLIVPWRKDEATQRPSVTIDGRRLRLEAAGVSRAFDPDRDTTALSRE